MPKTINNYETVIFLEIFLSLSSHWRTFQCTSKSEAYTPAADERNPEYKQDESAGAGEHSVTDRGLKSLLL